MGLKRYFDEGDLQELSFKHPKQLQSIDQLTSLAEINPPDGGSHKADLSGEAVGIFCESQCKYDNSNVVSDFNNKEFETSARISWVTSSTSEEDAGSGAVLCSSVFPEYCEFSFPRRNALQFEDPYSSLFNSFPRKEVPLGPDHQANVPVWDPEVGKHSISSINDDNDNNGGLMQQGTCVMPMPYFDFSADLGKSKDDRLDCSCLDGGSVRCVQQHVKEAREELKETIGIKKFVDLGFLEMGEEVAHKWTEEEEWLFHEVVYSNPVLHGKNFWVHLSAMLPSRTKWELVSYFFNVFMLRRRAAQNRSSWLDIDSDDDEWKGNGEGPFSVIGEDKNSAVVSFINQDVRVDHGDDSSNEYGDDDDNSSNGNDEDNDNNDDSDDNLQVNVVDATENAKGEYHMSKEKYENSLDDHRFDLMQHHMDGSLGSFKEFLDVQEDSCTSFEVQPHMTGSYYPIGERVALQESKVNLAWQKFMLGNGDGCSDRFGPQHASEEPCDVKVLDATYSTGLLKSEPCDVKVLDATYSTGLLKSVDLLPTCNMMEEIFGPCTWNSKSINDKSIS